MLEATQEAVHFAHGRERGDLGRDRLLTLALLKCLEIVGEAAARVAEQTKALYPSVPWADIIGMRNRLIHSYFEINLDLVWDTVVRDLPPLISELRAILRPPA
jgi:uncharacterized protein with HEPN domain